MFMRGAIRSGLVLGALAACLTAGRAAAAAGEAAGLPGGAVQAEAVGAAESGQEASTAGGQTHAAEGAGHGQPDLNPLDWKTDLALWTGAVFVALLFVLGKFAWGPIADGLDKREQRVAGGSRRRRRPTRTPDRCWPITSGSWPPRTRDPADDRQVEASEQAGQQIIERSQRGRGGEAPGGRRHRTGHRRASKTWPGGRDAGGAACRQGLRAELTPPTTRRLVDEAVAEFSRFSG